jgi:hypothetical protein
MNDIPTIQEKLNKEIKKLDLQQIISFARICALRALPFLGASGNFNFWKDSDRFRH